MIVLFIALGAANIAHAEAPEAPEAPCDDDRDDVGGAGVFMLGVAFTDLSDLNRHLSRNGYERIDSAIAVIGGQGFALFDTGLIIGGHGGAFLVPTADGPDAYRADVGGGFGMADFGFAFVRTPSMLLMATVGIGGYGMGLTITERLSLDFDDVLNEPRRSSTMSAGGVLGGIMLGFDGRVPLGAVDKHGMRPFFTVGVRAGGMYAPALGEWSLADGSELSRAPTTALSAAYAGVALGFGAEPARLSAGQ